MEKSLKRQRGGAEKKLLCLIEPIRLRMPEQEINISLYIRIPDSDTVLIVLTRFGKDIRQREYPITRLPAIHLLASWLIQEFQI